VQGKEVVNREYAKSTVDSHRGLSGTVIPSATTTSVGSLGAQFEVHPSEPLPFYATIQGPDGKEQEIFVSARAHKLLRKHNRNGELKIGFVEAVRMAAEEERTEKQGTMVDEVPPLPEASGPAGATGPVSAEVVDPAGPGGPDLNETVDAAVTRRRSRRPKLPDAPKMQPTPVVPTVNVTVDGPAGSVVLGARDVFLGGPGGMCLVIVQDRNLGTVYLPPVNAEDPAEFTISFEGEVYKAIPALYYQIPGTAIYHAVYLVV
jgi:hypothetical protein